MTLVLGLAVPFIVVQLLNQVALLRSTLWNFWFFVLEIVSLLLMPAVPVLYGWVSGNRGRSILVGGLFNPGVLTGRRPVSVSFRVFRG
ncbi:MAG: hypothetical protein PHV51_08605 [Methanosarcinaceae archaeon]|nr:hypothetical protein [Methanosarcinaceae archaeon]